MSFFVWRGDKMFRLNFALHSDLTDSLESIMSALVVQPKFESSKFSMILHSLFKVIPLNEMYGEYYIFLSTARLVEESNFGLEADSVLTRELYISILDQLLPECVMNDKIGIRQILTSLGLQTNLSIPDDLNKAIQVMYQRSVMLYDTLVELEKSPEESLGFIAPLRESYKYACSVELLSAQRELLSNNSLSRNPTFDGWKEFLGRNSLNGPNGLIKLLNLFTVEMDKRMSLSSRLLDANQSVSEKLTHFREQRQNSLRTIGKYSIPEYDETGGMRKSKYSVLVGARNIGKTTLGVDWAVNVFIEGGKIAIFSEETSEDNILFGHIIPNYLFKKYEIPVTKEEALDPELYNPPNTSLEQIESEKILIKRATEEVFGSDRILYIDSLNGATIYNDLKDVYRNFRFDFLMIDHSNSVGLMDANGRQLDRTSALNEMSSQLKRFKMDNSVHILLLSHSSIGNKSIKSVAEAQGITSYSKKIENDADDIFYIWNDGLDTEGHTAIMNTKRRDAIVIPDRIVIRGLFRYATFIYSSDDQQKGNTKQLVLKEYSDASPDELTTFGVTGASLLDDL